jgi:chromosome partitioning protein
MKVVSMLSQKGGSGKSTVCVHLAVAAHQAGLRTAIVDLDPQQSVRFWGDQRRGEPEVLGDHAKRLPMIVERAASAFDMLIVDTPPKDSGDALQAAKVADLVLIPCRPNVFDLHAVAQTLQTAKEARKPAFVVLSCAPVRSNVVQEAGALLKDQQDAKIAPVVIHQRVAFSHCLIDGKSALEFEADGKAAQEARDLFAWVCTELGISPAIKEAA